MGVIKEILKSIEKSNSFLVTSHINPDGDAIGSMGGIFYLLSSLNKEVYLYNKTNIPDRFSFLSFTKNIKDNFPKKEFDCLIFLDCGDKDRVGEEISNINATISINIDHHPTNDNFADINWVDPKMSSVGEMVFYLFKEANIDLQYEAMECIYTAIVSDTGSFTFSNTRPNTLKVVMEILEKDFDLDDFNRKYQRYWTINKLKLHGMAMQGAEIYFGGKLAIAEISREMFEITDTTSEDSEGIINYLRQIKGVKVAAVLREDGEKIKVSLRSWGEVDVSKIAMEFNGGGHKNASGGVLNMCLDEAKDFFIKCVSKYL